MTERKTDKKKERYKVKTFPVPFSVVEIQDNVSITSNNPYNISKEEIISRAFKFHSQGNISEAAKYYQYFLEQGFIDPLVLSNYGVILKGIGKKQEAEILHRKVIELKPNFAEGYYNLGNTLKDIGKLEESEISLKKAIELKPDYAKAHLNLGMILKDLEKLKEAEASTRKSIELNPTLFTSHFLLSKILAGQKKLQEAEASLLKTIELKPDFADAHSNLGNILQALGKLKEAEISTYKAIEFNPECAESHYNLGNICSALGKWEEAEISIRKSIKLKPDSSQSHIKLGEVLFELGRTEEASISEWNAIKIITSPKSLESYRENAKLINKTAFYVFSYILFSHFRPIIEINPSLFEILVPDDIDQRIIQNIRNDLNNRDIKIRSVNELIKNKLIYEKLVSIRGDDECEFIEDKKNMNKRITVPVIKLVGEKNIRFMYTAGKDKYTISSYWNKFYDGILCYGPYHENKFKKKHKIPTSQMGYPRFDKYFKPGFEKDDLIKKFQCDPKKKTIVWLPTWTNLSSIEKYLNAISLLRSDHNVVIRPHPSMKIYDPGSYKKLFSVDFNYIDDNQDDNVQLYALADLMLFDYGGPMFGALYLNKNFAFLEMNLEAKNHSYLGKMSSEDYLKSFFPERIAKLENLNSICNYCLINNQSNSVMKALREEFFNTNYQGNSAKIAYELLKSNNWLN